MSVVAFPDGTTITASTAFTPPTLEVFFQRLTATILGFTPASDSDASVWTYVRVGWLQSGQPGFAITDDVVFVRCTESDDPFGKYRQKTYINTSDPTTITQQITYARVWDIHWTLYGPNCFDHARQIKDAMLAGNYCYTQLAQSNLFVVPDVPALYFTNDLFGGRWWPRTDLKMRINEFITETQTLPTIASVEVDVYTAPGSETTESTVIING